MVYADLHVHTQRSDGQLTLSQVPAAAERAGVAVVALTDHDRLQPLDAPVVERDGVTLINGIELRVEPEGGERVDLLGYGVEPTPELEAEIERIQDDRIERGRRIVERVEDHLGVDLDVDLVEGVGRPHIARSIDAHEDVEHDYTDAFTELIGAGKPCYVPRQVTSFERGVEVLSAACGVVALAHPLRYEDTAAALSLCAALDAVELRYAYGTEVDVAPVERAVEAHDLLVTGGSDAHDHELGVAGLPAEEYERLAARLA